MVCPSHTPGFFINASRVAGEFGRAMWEVSLGGGRGSTAAWCCTLTEISH